MMNKVSLNNRFITGFIAGFLLPVVAFIAIYLFTSTDMSLRAFIERIIHRNILTHVISVCVFLNVIIFLVFNRYDKLKSAKGVLGVTIMWALAVFAIKLL